MDKFKIKLESLHNKADTTVAHKETSEGKVKQLKAEHISKDHDIQSLTIYVKNLEEQLDKAETSLTDTMKNFNEADLKAEAFEHHVNKLEAELVEKEKKLKEAQEAHRALKQEYEEFAKLLDEA
ncbi:hypothetical protein BC938DRAFT_477577 [Jimgerdemannia flammicorona]|uniref:Uncharacterized protein n=1 Tax=Jimgerdemannia flammicorona TaxID=994334 RepID=A0A433QP40_9FUNG|nr:hypothetical protein BC938DRAFT_477577 [Jimgerdemannia flammicorona]